ncbi:hypothetical protein [Candidatus Nitrosocosmicus hydrocola]|uniref:hypothetical protein n=1 Tax=Candidatus Nitrosocosmicus hydrocola TaxID=1826872 RepID=UPI0011E5CB97|nr:hypothetical protein [Candidatus Nitrosocosmicus hydrocola]
MGFVKRTTFMVVILIVFSFLQINSLEALTKGAGGGGIISLVLLRLPILRFAIRTSINASIVDVFCFINLTESIKPSFIQ